MNFSDTKTGDIWRHKQQQPWLLGVCRQLADKHQFDVRWVRVAAVVAAVCFPLCAVVGYFGLGMWLNR